MRLPDWEQRLIEYLDRVRSRAHQWGEHDCALHGANAAIALIGQDPAEEFRGRYSTATGSIRALKRYGAGDLRSTIDAKFEAIAPAFARRGDLAFFDGSVGVVIGGEALFVGEADGAAGLVRVPRAHWTAAWKVG